MVATAANSINSSFVPLYRTCYFLLAAVVGERGEIQGPLILISLSSEHFMIDKSILRLQSCGWKSNPVDCDKNEKINIAPNKYKNYQHRFISIRKHYAKFVF